MYYYDADLYHVNWISFTVSLFGPTQLPTQSASFFTMRFTTQVPNDESFPFCGESPGAKYRLQGSGISMDHSIPFLLRNGGLLQHPIYVSGMEYSSWGALVDRIVLAYSLRGKQNPHNIIVLSWPSPCHNQIVHNHPYSGYESYPMLLGSNRPQSTMPWQQCNGRLRHR